MKELSGQDLKKILNSQLSFEPDKYNQTEQKREYLSDLLNWMVIKLRLNTNLMCLNEVHDLLRELRFDLTIQQVHELFLFSTFQLKQERTKLTVKEKLLSLVNQERKRVDVDLMVEWLQKNMDSIHYRLPLTVNRSRSQRPVQQKLNKTTKLPRIRSPGKDRLKQQLEPLINLFDEMERLRHDSGLIPMKMEEDDEDLVELPYMHIPYDPELHDLNVNIAKLRIKAELQLKRIIDISRENPQIRKKLEQGIQKFQKSRIQKNEKIGRTGAINAQRRLAQQRHKQMQRHKQLYADFDQDLLRAARVYSLLNMPDPKNKPVY